MTTAEAVPLRPETLDGWASDHTAYLAGFEQEGDGDEGGEWPAGMADGFNRHAEAVDARYDALIAEVRRLTTENAALVADRDSAHTVLDEMASLLREPLTLANARQAFHAHATWKLHEHRRRKAARQAAEPASPAVAP